LPGGLPVVLLAGVILRVFVRIATGRHRHLPLKLPAAAARYSTQSSPGGGRIVSGEDGYLSCSFPRLNVGRAT
jgi:hypothetical protein